MIEGSVKMVDMSAGTALAQYAAVRALRGKGLADTARKVAGYWVRYATAKIPKGDAKKIEGELSSVIGAYSRIGTARTKTANAWRGTLAARLAAGLNWEGARSLRGPAFYDKVKKFVGRRKSSANLHRAGMLPALDALRSPRGGLGRMKKYKNPPGGFSESLKEQLTNLLMENWASGGSRRSDGITGLAPAAFDASVAEIDKVFTEFMIADIKKLATEKGFTATA